MKTVLSSFFSLLFVPITVTLSLVLNVIALAPISSFCKVRQADMRYMIDL